MGPQSDRKRKREPRGEDSGKAAGPAWAREGARLSGPSLRPVCRGSRLASGYSAWWPPQTETETSDPTSGSQPPGLFPTRVRLQCDSVRPCSAPLRFMSEAAGAACLLASGQWCHREGKEVAAEVSGFCSDIHGSLPLNVFLTKASHGRGRCQGEGVTLQQGQAVGRGANILTFV